MSSKQFAIDYTCASHLQNLLQILFTECIFIIKDHGVHDHVCPGNTHNFAVTKQQCNAIENELTSLLTVIKKVARHWGTLETHMGKTEGRTILCRSKSRNMV